MIVDKETLDAYTIKPGDSIQADALEKGLDQDTIAKSYLEHASLYNQYAEARQKAMDSYYMLEKSNGVEHPAVVEAKAEWDKATELCDSEASIMRSMLEMLDVDTLQKYEQDMKSRGAVPQDVSF